MRVQHEQEWLFGVLRRRMDGNYDCCFCFSDLSKGFLQMLAFVSVITLILVLYAIFA